MEVQSYYTRVAVRPDRLFQWFGADGKQFDSQLAYPGQSVQDVVGKRFADGKIPEGVVAVVIEG